MGIHPRDTVLAALLLLPFPVGLVVTDVSSSEPGDLGSPTRESVPVSVSSH